LVWLPSVANDFVDWDDLPIIVKNPRFNPPTFASVGWYWTHVQWNLYQPVTATMWGLLAWLGWVDTPDQFGGHMNPALFHLASVLMHALSALLLFVILRRLVRRDWPAAAGALVFALHPIQTEAIAFVGAMNNPLFACLGLLAIWQYIRFTDDDTGGKSRWSRFITATICLILSLLAKPTAVVVPPIALLLDATLHPARRCTPALRSIAPWLALALACAVWTHRFQSGAAAAEQAPVWFRPFIAGDAAAFYLYKIINPTRLAIDYGHNPLFLLAHERSYVVWLAPAGLLILSWVALRERRPLQALASAIFLIALLPNSGLVPFDYQSISTTTDRYAYLAMAGVAVAVAAALAEFAAPRRTTMLTVAIVALLSVWVVLTQIQIQTWRNGRTLFRHAVAINPNSWMSWGNLANVVADSDPDEAIAACHRAIAANPLDASSYNTLGSVLMEKGQTDEGLAAFAAAHANDPGNPTFSENYKKAKAAATAAASAPATNRTPQ
jgi:tetratricopeptide (TPR) repeat protein